MYIIYLFRYIVKPTSTSATPSSRGDVTIAIGQTTTQPEADNVASLDPPPTKKRKRGQNKQRPRAARISFSEMLCPHLYSSNLSDSHSCPFGERCRYMHDVAGFMASKPPDVDKTCYLFSMYGKCPYGRACRFGTCHLSSDHENIINDKVYNSELSVATVNVLSKTLQENLRKRRIEFVRSEAYLSKVESSVNPTRTNTPCKESEGGQTKNNIGLNDPQPLMKDKDTSSVMDVVGKDSAPTSTEDVGVTIVSDPIVGSHDTDRVSHGALTDEGMVKLRQSEKKKV